MIHAGWNHRDQSLWVTTAVALRLQSAGVGRVEREAFGGGERIRIEWELLRQRAPLLRSLPAVLRTWVEDREEAVEEAVTLEAGLPD